jgi:hypothetical protein
MNPSECSFISTICNVYKICQYKIGLRDDLNVLQVFLQESLSNPKFPAFRTLYLQMKPN